jgi:nicotinamidase/pyrazinamidase
MIKRILLRVLLVVGLVIAVLAANLFLFNITARKVSEGQPIENRDPHQVALLVIDIQEGTTGGTSAMKALVAQSEEFISQTNRVIEEAAGRGQLIVYIRTEVVNPLLNVLNNTMARGTEGAELDHRLLIKEGPVVVKRKNDPFLGTELDRILGEYRISGVVLVGLDASQCVRSTVLAAHNRGYHISVVQEAVISKEAELKNQAFNEFREMGVEILSLD